MGAFIKSHIVEFEELISTGDIIEYPISAITQLVVTDDFFSLMP